MNHSTSSSTNPFASASLVTPAGEPVLRASRPIGTLIIAPIVLATGVFVCFDRLNQLSMIFFSGQDVYVDPSYYVSLTRDSITAVTALVAAIGLFIGRGFGWWLAVAHCFWRLATQVCLPLIGALSAQFNPSAPSQAKIVSAAVVPGLIFISMLIYLQKGNVMSYFRIGAGRVVLNVGMLLLTVVVAFCLDLWWAATQW